MGLRYTGNILSAGLNGINYPVTTVEYLVVAGGGGGGKANGGDDTSGGGGAGGLLTATGYAVTVGSAITITIGAGLTGTESGASGGYKRATITAGTGNVSWA